jgi:flagellar hook-basal body complex protein FliE
MSSPIHSLGIPPGIPEIRTPAAPDSAGESGGTFKQALSDAVAQVEQYRQSAETGVAELLSGQREDIHNVALATQRAELSFELFLQTRNKVVQAYQEVMRMQV